MYAFRDHDTIATQYNYGQLIYWIGIINYKNVLSSIHCKMILSTYTFKRQIRQM